MTSEWHENILEWCTGDKEACITVHQKKYVNRVRELAEKYPDKVIIKDENVDGSIHAHIPVSSIKISIIDSNRTEEQKAEAVERLRKAREARKTTTA